MCIKYTVVLLELHPGQFLGQTLRAQSKLSKNWTEEQKRIILSMFCM